MQEDKSSKVRTQFIRFRVHPEEKEEILSRVPWGKNLAEWARSTLLNKRVVNKKMPTVAPELEKELRKIGINLNQIARKVNSNLTLDSLDVELLLMAMNEVAQEINQLKEEHRVKEK